MGTTVVNKNGVEFDIDAIASDLNMKLEKDLVNITDSGKAKCANYAMPSANYLMYTVGAAGSTYMAPADGWFCFYGTSTAAGAYTMLYVNELETRLIQMCGRASATSQFLASMCPCQKGDSIAISYSNLNGSSTTLWFIYAVGAESEAS